MHPKSMYRNTPDGIEERLAMNFGEEWDLVKAGWFPHPEEARQVVPVDEPRKPGRPRKA